MMLPLRAFRGLYKPTGMPRLDVSCLPRGLRSCFPFADLRWTNLGPVNNNQPARIGSLVSTTGTFAGPALAPNYNGLNTNAEISYSADNLTSAGSIEVLFITGSTLATTALAGFNGANDGNSTTQDK